MYMSTHTGLRDATTTGWRRTTDVGANTASHHSTTSSMSSPLVTSITSMAADERVGPGRAGQHHLVARRPASVSCDARCQARMAGPGMASVRGSKHSTSTRLLSIGSTVAVPPRGPSASLSSPTTS